MTIQKALFILSQITIGNADSYQYRIDCGLDKPHVLTLEEVQAMETLMKFIECGRCKECECDFI